MNYNIFHIPNLSSLLKRAEDMQNKLNVNQKAGTNESFDLHSQNSLKKETRGRPPKVSFEEFKKLYKFYWSFSNTLSFDGDKKPSVKDFCQQYGIPERTYYLYKLKLA